MTEIRFSSRPATAFKVLISLAVVLLALSAASIAAAQEPPPIPGPTGHDLDAVAQAQASDGGVAVSAVADPYEPDNRSDQAKDLVAGVTQTHSLTVDDADWMTFTLYSTSAVSLQASGTPTTGTEILHFQLLDSNLDWVNTDHSTPPSLDASMEYTCEGTPLAPGKYYVLVMEDEFANGRTGLEVESYDVSLATTSCYGLQIAPIGDTTDTTPRYKWNEVPGATEYNLWVIYQEDGLKVWRKTYQARICDAGVCAVTPQRAQGHGVYDWTVTAYTPDGEVTSDWVTYSIDSVVPELIGPFGNIKDTTPRYRWTVADAATAYELLVTRTSDGAEVFRKTYATRICDAGRCAVTPGKVLPLTGYTYQVQAVKDVVSVWSDPGQFTIQ